jgi:fluoroacetyl-CoA thioesterase
VADLSHLQVGMTGTHTVVVTDAHLATVVGSGNAPVYASPMMIAAMEAACVDCVEAKLPEHHQSLGMHLDVRHISPTPKGLTVTATAELIAIDGRKLTFKVAAHDGIDMIGSGTHVRAVVDTPRFIAKVQSKKQGI